MNDDAIRRDELDVADTAALFLLVSLPWLFTVARFQYDWDLAGFGPLLFLALFHLRNTMLFGREKSSANHVSLWRTALLLISFLAFIVVLIAAFEWLDSRIDRLFLLAFGKLVIATFWIRDIWLASLKAKGQLPDRETLFPRARAVQSSARRAME